MATGWCLKLYFAMDHRLKYTNGHVINPTQLELSCLWCYVLLLWIMIEHKHLQLADSNIDIYTINIIR